MAKETDLVRAVVNESSTLKDTVTNSGVDLYSGSISEIGAPIIEDPLARNTFLNVLYNKFIMSEVISGLFKNPLSVLKRGKVSGFGDTIERMIFNPAKAIEYSNTDDNILTTVKPDVKVEYIRVSRQDKYRVSIPFAVIKQAFMSENNFNEFVNGCINSLRNGDTIDEFLLMKKIVIDSITNAFIPERVIDTTKVVDFAKEIINSTKYFTFPSSEYNAYSKKYGVSDSKLTTWCNPEEIALVIRADAMTNIDVDVLAAAYHLDKVNLTKNIIEVDKFDDEGKILGIACDKSFFQVADTLTEMASFTRADDLSEKTYWHHWQTMTFSLLANVVAFVTEKIGA